MSVCSACDTTFKIKSIDLVEKKDKLFVCSRCTLVKYHNKLCQRVDWNNHKLFCNPDGGFIELNEVLNSSIEYILTVFKWAPFDIEKKKINNSHNIYYKVRELPTRSISNVFEVLSPKFENQNEFMRFFSSNKCELNRALLHVLSYLITKKKKRLIYDTYKVTDIRFGVVKVDDKLPIVDVEWSPSLPGFDDMQPGRYTHVVVFFKTTQNVWYSVDLTASQYGIFPNDDSKKKVPKDYIHIEKIEGDKTNYFTIQVTENLKDAIEPVLDSMINISRKAISAQNDFVSAIMCGIINYKKYNL
jgi:hypothetical protein